MNKSSGKKRPSQQSAVKLTTTPRRHLVFATINRRKGGEAVGSSDETLDTLFHGRLKIRQSRPGYRFSLDALLLARFVTVRPGDAVADLGSGNGVIALILAHFYPDLTVTAVELQRGMVQRARENTRLNGFEKRIKILCGDVRQIARVAAPESHGAVVCNPPYRVPTSGRISPDPEKRLARHEIAGRLMDFVCAGAYLLPANGRMAAVYPALRVVDLLGTMREANIEPKRLRMVHSFTGAEASLVLVEGVKGGRSGIEVLAPLVIYEKGKQYGAEVASLLAGDSQSVSRLGSKVPR
jgi:tRNA1Val (adenine37-N6)-methyltransferase